MGDQVSTGLQRLQFSKSFEKTKLQISWGRHGGGLLASLSLLQNKAKIKEPFRCRKWIIKIKFTKKIKGGVNEEEDGFGHIFGDKGKLAPRQIFANRLSYYVLIYMELFSVYTLL